ncbi:MAG: hypothetical protein HY690_13485, partial [Chloroflexi bacterium]|nr:hypothetical protein [Chloroflexota bacterium]
MNSTVAQQRRRQVRRPGPRRRPPATEWSARVRRLARARPWGGLRGWPWTRPLAFLAAAALALVALLAPGGWLGLALGLAAPLVPLWLAWLGLSSLPRPPVPRVEGQAVAGAALVSAALPPLLSLLGVGGLVGDGLRLALEGLLGQSGALFALLLAASAGPLLMLGERREGLVRWALSRVDLTAAPSPQPSPRGRGGRSASPRQPPLAVPISSPPGMKGRRPLSPQPSPPPGGKGSKPFASSPLPPGGGGAGG